MNRKHTYQAVPIQQVRVSELLGLVMAGCIVALDVAKTKWLVAVATAAGEVVKLFRFEHPVETTAFLKVVTELRGGVAGGKVDVVMEPTGTYGDAVRYQLVNAGARVFAVSPKRTHDSKEIFDGVPSLHDAKSAVLIAKLHAMGLSKEWLPPSEMRTRLRALVDLRQREERREEECHGWLEASLARHWPELLRSAKLREQKSALHLLAAYPNPRAVAAAPEEVRNLLRERSRGRLPDEIMEEIVAGARSTLGVPMVPEQERCVEVWASQALDACQRQEALEAEMRAVGKADAIYERLRVWMGTVTAAVLMTMCDPMQYASARQLEKAAGLNMREKSSGEHSGRLSITKRGPGLVRQMLFLFALRMINADAIVRAWYERRRGYREGSKTRAIVAVMRKLLRAAFHVARGSSFDANKLFDVRRLDSPAKTAATSVEALADATAAAPKVVATPVIETTTNSSKQAHTTAAAPTAERTAAATSAPQQMGAMAATPGPAGAIVNTERERPVARRATRKRPERAAVARSVEAPADEGSITTNVVATQLAETTPATTTVAKEPIARVDSINVARTERPAAARGSGKQAEGASSPPIDALSKRAPMALPEIATAGRDVIAACADAAGAPLSADIPPATPRRMASERRRARTASRAST
jgi:transposase